MVIFLLKTVFKCIVWGLDLQHISCNYIQTIVDIY